MLTQAESIPDFRDDATVGGLGTTVAFARKAQLLCVDLFCRFGSSEPLFRFVDMADFGPDTGAYAVAALRDQGCITCSPAVAERIEGEHELPAGVLERRLRAACLVASCRAAALVGVPAWQLSRWLQSRTDEAGTRVRVHRTCTVAY